MVLRKDIVPVNPASLMREGKPDRFIPAWQRTMRKVLGGTDVPESTFGDLFAGMSEGDLWELFRQLPPVFINPAVQAMDKVAITGTNLRTAGMVPGETQPRTKEQRALFALWTAAMVSLLLILAACSAPPTVDGTGNQGVQQVATVVVETTEAMGVAPEESAPPASVPTAAPTLVAPTEAAAIEYPVKVEPPTAVPTEAPPPTPEVAPVSPEIPFRVENGVVQKWTVNPITNQEEWVPDESFPYEEIKALAKENYQTYKIGSITKDSHGNFNARDLNYGREDGRPGILRAIKTQGGEWQASHQFNAAEYLPQNADPETMTPLEFDMPAGFTIGDAEARNFRLEFIRKLIELNPEFFNYYTGNSGTSLENVLRIAGENGNLIPHLPDQTPGLAMPTKGRIDTIYISNTPVRAGVDQAINIGNIAVLIFTPETFANDARIEAFLQSANTKHTLCNGTPGTSPTTGMALVGDRLVFIHGTEYDYYPSGPGVDPYFESVRWWRFSPGEAFQIIGAFTQGYLEAFDPKYNDKMFAPFIPYYDQVSGNVCTGGRRCEDPIRPPIQLVQLATP